jgi:hypothetical protein
MILPNTIIAGAPKSGSSSLYWWLSAHPEVCASMTKETHFFDDSIHQRFNANANVHEHDLSIYAEYFKHCSTESKVVMEATPIYLYQKSAIEHLSRFSPKPKVIFILREPSQRAHSQFRFNKYRLGNIPLHQTYDEYLASVSGTTSCPLDRGNYIHHLQPWITAFGKSQLYVLQLEALQKDRQKEMRLLCQFLGIDELFYQDFGFMHRNETRKMRSTWLHRFGLKVQPLVPLALQEKVLVPLYLKLNSTAMPPVSNVDKQRIEEQKGLFIDTNLQLQSAFPSIDLALWK